MKFFDRIVLYLLFVLTLIVGITELGAEKMSSKTTAINGYDTVAYFTKGKALPGNQRYFSQWNGMIWYFSNKEHKDLFDNNPEKYAPQYNGYCAWAMAESRKAETDPEVWKIVNGKLYLNCSKSSFESWSKDIPGNIKKADKNWLKFSDNK
jgi:YHS domain-containing protein